MRHVLALTAFEATFGLLLIFVVIFPALVTGIIIFALAQRLVVLTRCAAATTTKLRNEDIWVVIVPRHGILARHAFADECLAYGAAQALVGAGDQGAAAGKFQFVGRRYHSSPGRRRHTAFVNSSRDFAAILD